MATFGLTEGADVRSVRRRASIVLFAVIAVVVTAVPGAAAEDIVEFSFNDPTGDATYAPDVTTVTGTWGTTLPLRLDITLGNIADPGFLGEFQYVIVGFDVDFDGRQDFNLLSTGSGGTRICEREPGGDPNVFVCQFDGERVFGELVGEVLSIELLDTDLLGSGFRFSVLGRNEDPNETDFAGLWGVALADEQPPEIQVAMDPIVLWPTGPDGNDVFEYRFLVRAVDLIDPDPELLCDPPSGSLLPIGETDVTCTATDDAGNTSSRTFKVIVLSPVEVLATLETTVSESPAAPARGLAKIINQAARHLETDRPEQACRLLQAFITAAAQLGAHEQTGVPDWWSRSIGLVAEQILQCDG